MDFQKSFTDAYNLVKDKIGGWIEKTIIMIPNLIMALLIVVAFVFIARLAKWAIRKLFKKKQNLNSNLLTIASNLGYFFVMLLGIFIALSVLNLDKTVTSLLAGAGVIGLALGFAFQDTASNFISGLFIAFRKPFKKGDFIETEGYLGTVKEINIRSIIVETVHGLEVIIPNKEVFQNAITNYTSTKKRRVDISCGVSYDDDLDLVEKLTREAVKDIKSLSTAVDDPISFIYDEFGGSSINFKLRLWLEESSQGTYLGARSQAIKNIKKVFDKNGVSIPFPIRTLDLGPEITEKLRASVSKKETSKESKNEDVKESK